MLHMNFETEYGTTEDFLEELDEDADERGAAFIRGEEWANDEILQNWENDY